MWRETRDSLRNPLTRQAPDGYFSDTPQTGTLQPMAGGAATRERPRAPDDVH